MLNGYSSWSSSNQFVVFGYCRGSLSWIVAAILSHNFLTVALTAALILLLDLIQAQQRCIQAFASPGIWKYMTRIVSFADWRFSPSSGLASPKKAFSMRWRSLYKLRRFCNLDEHWGKILCFCFVVQTHKHDWLPPTILKRHLYFVYQFLPTPLPFADAQLPIAVHNVLLDQAPQRESPRDPVKLPRKAAGCIHFGLAEESQSSWLL